ncbi:M48 family metallopeptidase [Nibrella viscosa]|uniref:M48 family metallopeptidase n=1 Tax=Nibrella viscosa TaxID=1084524 RepID=A0ABP8KP10_9BACT
MSVQATFFDGTLPEAHPAEIYLDDEVIRITYASADGFPHTDTWLVKKTRLADWHPAGKTRLQYGSFPHQYLDFATADYQAAVLPRYAGRPLTQVSKRLWVQERGFLTVLLITALLIALAWGLYVYGLPALADRAVELIPPAQEQKLGEVLYKQVISEERLPVDPARTQWVNAYWQAVGLPTRFPGQITVVKHNEINAFAIPGGHIVVYDSLLNRMSRHEQLAALLAHETAHIEYRHSLQQLTRSVASYAVLSLLFGDVTGLMAVLIDNAHSLTSLSFSRDKEDQADAFAVEALARQGIDPQGVVWMLHVLPKEGKLGPSALSTHPETTERLAAATKRIQHVRIMAAGAGQQRRLAELWQQIAGQTNKAHH